MDTKEKEQLAQEQLNQLREALKTVSVTDSKDTITACSELDTLGPVTYDYNNMFSSSITAGSGTYTVPTGIGLTSGYTLNTSSISPMWNSPLIGGSESGKIEVSGENADIVVNGKSLCDAITNIEQRLNILTPNKELEKEWNELKELGDKYRALELELTEKASVWQKLKQ